MALDRSGAVLTPALKVGAAALGSFVAGPLGCATGAFLGGVLGDVFGKSAAALVATCAEKFGEACAEKILGSQLDSLAERLREHKQPQVEEVYRQAFRESLIDIHAQVGDRFDGWFENWAECLKSKEPLDLDGIQPAQIVPANFVSLLSVTMQRLDRQGKALRDKSQSLLAPDLRPLPGDLLDAIETHLPEHFKGHFHALIVTEEYRQAWKEVELEILKYQIDVLEKIKEDTSETRKMVEFLYAKAQAEGKVPAQNDQAKEEEISRLTAELQNLKYQLAARSSQPSEAELSELLKAGDLDAALRLKSQQVNWRSENVKRLSEEAAKLPRDYFELGTIHELRFEWPQALAAYRQSWELSHDPELGFRYALFAAKLNHHAEAIAVFESLLGNHTDSAERAATLNNLANLYRTTQRMLEAEQDYGEALAVYRKLAEDNPDAYLPDVAMMLNNLAILYSDTQRMQEAERDYAEALAIRRELAEANPDAYLPKVATTLNNFAVLYRDTQRMQEAERNYAEALAIQRKLAEANPDAYLPYVAGTLNNLAILYRATQRMQEAERDYGAALAIYRKLAEDNPEACLPYVATTLNNLAVLYRATQRTQEAERALGEALAVYRKLAEPNPDAYLPYVAPTLNNLANLYRDTQRMQEAERDYGEALAIYRRLAEPNPDAYLPNVALTLNNLAVFHFLNERFGEAEALTAEAEGILDPLWQANPELHGNQLARILSTRALVREAAREAATACAFARRALAAAWDTSLKESIQQQIDRLCPPSDS